MSNRPIEPFSTTGARRTAIVFAALAIAVLLCAYWMVFFYVPTERTMGIVQRIFYVHVPTAWVAFLAFGLVAFCSAGYLWLRDERLDAIAVSAAELGTVLISAALITGPLWARIAWGTWWTWEPRLTLTLLLWFIYIGYFMLRGSTENPERGKRFAAVLGVVGAFNIPLIHMSVQWFRSLHPQPVILRPEGPQADPEIVQTLVVSFFGFLLLFIALLMYRYGAERLDNHLKTVQAARRVRRRPASEGVLR